jgi:hypothetical protein
LKKINAHDTWYFNINLYKCVCCAQWARQVSIPSQLMQGDRGPQTRPISMKPSRLKLVTISDNLVYLVWSISKIHRWPLLTGRLPLTALRTVNLAPAQIAFNTLSLSILADLGPWKTFVLFPFPSLLPKSISCRSTSNGRSTVYFS